MPLWGNQDAASNSTIFAAAKVKKAPNTANRDALFGNTTANAYFDGVTIAQVAVDANEVAANPGVAHTGWSLRTEGSGGRAGRVFHEVLVAGGITNDASDDALVPDYAVVITTQPSSVSANSTANELATFTVVANTKPAGGTVTYIWQSWNGSAFANLSNAGAYSNTTTKTLSVKANTASNGEIYRARMTTSAGSATVKYSSNSVLTITT